MPVAFHLLLTLTRKPRNIIVPAAVLTKLNTYLTGSA